MLPSQINPKVSNLLVLALKSMRVKVHILIYIFIYSLYIAYNLIYRGDWVKLKRGRVETKIKKGGKIFFGGFEKITI